MNLDCKNSPRKHADDTYDLAVSSGGATAILAGTGTVLACDLSGIKKFRQIMGVSGGGIFGSILSSGPSISEVLHMSLKTDFSKYLRADEGIASTLTSSVCRLGRASPRKPEKPESPHFESWNVSGVLGSAPLGRFVLQQLASRNIHEWPERFVTMATTRDGSALVFNKDGAFLVSTSGIKTQLANEAVPVDMAVRASATIVGVIAAIEYKGMMLFDGGLSRDGLCPVGVQIRHFGADPRKIIACRVGEDSLSRITGGLHRLARVLWRVHPEYHWGPETAGVIEFRPPIEHVHSLKFELTRDEKWLAILVAFEAASASLALSGILAGENLVKVQSIFEDLGYWRDYIPARAGEPQVLANRAERTFAKHELY